MTQVSQAWGAGPSARYDTLAEQFRPIFTKIRATAVSRETDHILPREEIGWLKEAGFTKLRIPESEGGFGVTLPEFFSLLLELSVADSNVTNALRAHFGFTEDVLYSSFAEWRARWLPRIVAGETLGSGFSETGDTKVTAFSTKLVRQGPDYALHGRKFYTTGSLLADYINLGASDESDQSITAVVPLALDGVEVLDDWDGFGQQLTASGTAIFNNVTLPADYVNPSAERFKFSPGFFQTVHLATLAGIARSAANDVATLVAERKRVFSHGNAPTPAQDAQVLQIVGRVRGAAYAAGAIVLKVSESLQRVYDARLAGDLESAEAANAIADIEVSQAVTVVSDLVLQATTLLFDALGASSASRTLGLDRHWRNARTITSHNPRIYRDRIVGDYAVNGTPPPAQWRVGVAATSQAAE